VQRILAMVKLLEPSGINGDFGSDTKAAVESFQDGNGLTVDGIVGHDTWAAMPGDPETLHLFLGAQGPIVSALQQGLLTYGGSGSPTDPSPDSGTFGSATESAVKAYQSDRGLTPDGIVGDRTWWEPAGAAGATLASLSGLTTA